MSTLEEQLIEASIDGNVNKAKQLIENGVDIHAYNDRALRQSAENGHLNFVKYLVENGADIHANNDYALRWSAHSGHLSIVKYLVENGADIHARDNFALHWSAKYNYLEVVKYLVENGADTKILFKYCTKKQIIELFLGDEYCDLKPRHTDELCSESFELPDFDDIYIVWEDNSISILEHTHLASIEPDIIKGVYRQEPKSIEQCWNDLKNMLSILSMFSYYLQ